MSDDEDVHSSSEDGEESEEEAQSAEPAEVKPRASEVEEETKEASDEEKEEEEKEESDKEEEEEEKETHVDEKKEKVKMPPPKSGPSEAELAMKRRREAQAASGILDEAAQELLEANMEERVKLEAEIEEMRKKSEQRKKERMEEEKRMAEKRNEEEARRKAEEEERKKKKEEEEASRKEERASKMAEFEKFKNPQKRNFVISSSRKGAPSGGEEEEEGSGEEKKSREQLEAEKKAILAQRITPLNISGCDSAKLMDKAKELHSLIMRLEGEKYDLEKQFKEQQIDMLELAERARSINKVGKGGLKRITLTDGSDKIQERFAGAPAKIVMFSQFERQKDNRSYVDRRDIFLGPTYVLPPNRIVPTKILKWSEDGLPIYEDMEGVEQEQEAQEE